MVRIIYTIAFIIIVILSSCGKEKNTYFKYDSYVFSSNDEDAGNWKTVLLSSNEQIQIAAPAEPSSSGYKTELVAVKSAIDKASKKEKEAVDFWSNNPINRWSEITLSLIAKYNLKVGPDANGNYALPDSNKPFNYPYFPCSHPPYGARALAYLSVATFDGLITAWHYKYKYNRAAPYVQDSKIKYAYVKNNIPSYPSDGAVVAEVARQVLSEMFPTEKVYLQKKADEHLKSLLLSGGYTQSDIDAGKTIASQVAAIAIQRAKADGVGKAQCPKPVADSISNAAFQKFGWRWENQEIPKRKVGIAPLWGQVRLWNVPKIEDVRLPPPPAPGSPEFKEAESEIVYYEKIRNEETTRIAMYWVDGIDTYGPPGHWNRFAKEFIIQYNFNPIRSARTYAYLNMALSDVAVGCWDSKYYYNYPRPIQLLKNFNVLELTPNFPSYPSGHSCFSTTAAEILAYVFPQEATKVREWAKEAGMSRVYGGIHWQFDNSGGAEQGRNVANFSINRAKADGAK